MHIAYSLSEALPPLAWVATCRPGRRTICVRHGRFVETRPDFFVEGAWAGSFDEGLLTDSDTVFGSGGRLSAEAVTFVSCTATTDFLYHNGSTDPFCISNSLPLLLAMLDDELLTRGADYDRINRSILRGIHHYRAAIPTRKGEVTRVMHHNVLLSCDGITLLEKRPTPGFKRFEDYRCFVQERIGALLANARHTTRRHPMRVFSTQSRGYDSTAVNALAAPFGIDHVFTSAESKEKGRFYSGGDPHTPSDDGTDICAVLGLPCTRIDRRSFEKKPLRSEEFYWAGLDNNSDLNLHEITSYMNQPTLLLTGQYGEFWYTRDATGEHRMHCFDDALKKWDLAGHGLSEVRLKTGFVQAAIPVIGSRNRADILRITESPEMAPWRLNTRYDRPIPRRIAEEAGVPRELFGQLKLASIVHLPTPNVPITPRLRAAYFRHLVRHRLLGHVGIHLLPLAQRLNSWIYWKNPSRYFNDRRKHPLLWYVSYGWSRLFGRPLRIRMVLTRLDASLYAFCVNQARREYARRLDPQTTDGTAGADNPITVPSLQTAES